MEDLIGSNVTPESVSPLYNALFLTERTPEWWIGILGGIVIGGAVAAATYYWYTAPTRALRSLMASRACALAARCAEQKVPIEVDKLDVLDAPPGAAKMYNFEAEGVILTARRAAQIGKVSFFHYML